MKFSLTKTWPWATITPKKPSLKDQFRNAVYGDYMHTRQNEQQNDWMEAWKVPGKGWSVRIIRQSEDALTGEDGLLTDKGTYETGLSFFDAVEKLADYAINEMHNMSALPKDESYFVNFARREAIIFDTDYKPHPTDNGRIVTDGIFTQEEHDHAISTFQAKISAFEHLPEMLLIPALSEDWDSNLLENATQLKTLIHNIKALAGMLSHAAGDVRWSLRERNISSWGSEDHTRKFQYIGTVRSNITDALKMLVKSYKGDQLVNNLSRAVTIVELNLYLHIASYLYDNIGRECADQSNFDYAIEQSKKALCKLGYSDSASHLVAVNMLNSTLSRWGKMDISSYEIKKIAQWLETVLANLKDSNHIPLTKEEQELLAVYEDNDMRALPETAPALATAAMNCLPQP